MLIRCEIALRPEHSDAHAQEWLRKIELALPDVKRNINWIRVIDVISLELETPREKSIGAIAEVFQDKVLQWLFTGNLIPSAAGNHGTLLDLMENAPYRPGVFFGLEKRYRLGIKDRSSESALEALEIVLGTKLRRSRAASGTMLLLEGAKLDESQLSRIAREVFCNELIESFSLYREDELLKTGRFLADQVQRVLPKQDSGELAQFGTLFRPKRSSVEEVGIADLSGPELVALSKERCLALSLAEMQVIQTYFANEVVIQDRLSKGLPREPTDVELEVLAQTWSEHCKHKIFQAKVQYKNVAQTGLSLGARIPEQISGLFRETIQGATQRIDRPWLLSVFHDNSGVVALDEEDAVCIKVETHNAPSALDPYAGALTGIVGVNRDILGTGRGAKPLFNTNVFCVAPLDYSRPLPDRVHHPRRILDGLRLGVEHGGNKSGIPTVNGAIVIHESYLGRPLVFCGTAGLLPRTVLGTPSTEKLIQSGDKVVMIGGRIGKDGIHGATMSSQAIDEFSPVTAVQLGDPLTQKRVLDFLLEARDLGLYRTLTDNGAGGLSSSVGELAQLSKGASIDLAKAKTKAQGLLPYEIIISESQERMTLAVPPDKLDLFLAFSERRGVESSVLGEFHENGAFDIQMNGKRVGYLPLEFLHGGCPRMELKATWKGSPELPPVAVVSFEKEAPQRWLELMGRPNIASKEEVIRQYDHEVQGTSVIKPLHTVSVGTSRVASGPNDAAVIKPKSNSFVGVVAACGLAPKFSAYDPYLMAQHAVDEAVRNALCVGAEYGQLESVLALVDNFCWPDPTQDEEKMAALVRCCYGIRDACIALEIPLISGKDSMKNDYKGMLQGQPVTLSITPTLLMTAIGRMSDVRLSRSADAKAAGDAIYLLGGRSFGLVGSELHECVKERLQQRGARDNQTVLPSFVAHREGAPTSSDRSHIGLPNWNLARRVYSWIGGATGRRQAALRSLHDVSEGGLAVALAESLIARNFGATLQAPESVDLWEFYFGEGFHSFVATAAEADAYALEGEWRELEIPHMRLGSVVSRPDIEIHFLEQGVERSLTVTTQKLMQAFMQKKGS